VVTCKELNLLVCLLYFGMGNGMVLATLACFCCMQSWEETREVIRCHMMA